MPLIKIERVWLTEDCIWIRTADGQEAFERFADYPRLKNASVGQRNNFETDDFGIHWPEIDEDLSFEGFFDKKPVNLLYRIFMEHPELNASAVARRLGISQSLFAQYISGAKRPSKERELAILNEIRKVGEELIAI